MQAVFELIEGETSLHIQVEVRALSATHVVGQITSSGAFNALVEGVQFDTSLVGVSKRRNTHGAGLHVLTVVTRTASHSIIEITSSEGSVTGLVEGQLLASRYHILGVLLISSGA